jgi:transposase
MPIKCIITSGATADCTQAATLIGGLEAAYLLADRGYDTHALMDIARAKGIESVIPLNVIARSRDSMTGNFTRQGIWWKTPSFI